MATVKNFLQVTGLQTTKSFLGVTSTGAKNFLDTTEGEQYTRNLLTQKDKFLEALVKYVGRQTNGQMLIDELSEIEYILMTQCAQIATTPGCC